MRIRADASLQIAAVSIVFALSLACTRNRQASPMPPVPAQNPHSQDTKREGKKLNPSLPPPGAGVEGGSENPMDSAAFPFELDEKKVAKHVTYSDDLRYRFQYGGKEESKAITFTNGKAQISIGGLKSGIESDLILEIIETNIVKLRGDKKGVKLNPGPNHVELTLRPVNSSDTATITLNIELDNPGGSGEGSNKSDEKPNDPGTIPIDEGGSQDGGGSGNSQADASFAQDIKPIFDRHCAECHHAGAKSPDLTVTPGQNIQGIILQIEGGTMPPAPRDRVSAGDVAKIKTWAASLD